MFRLLAIVFGLILISCADKKVDGIIFSGYVFQDELSGQCHASSIVETGDGKLMTVWFGGSYEGAEDVAILASSFTNEKWEKPYKLAVGFVNDSVSLPCWNPVLHMSVSGRLFLFYKIGKNPREWRGMMKFSDDNGLTWSESAQLPDGVLGPIKNKPVNLSDGSFICPSSVETLDDKWIAHLEIFTKDGLYVRSIQIDHGDSIGAIQPSVLFHPGDKMQILCRSRQNHIAQSWSFDGGKSWEKMTLLDVKNPNSGTDAVTLKDGRHLLVYNPLAAGKDWWNGRNILKLAVSTDGIHWKDLSVLESHKDGEYSYPAIIQDSKGFVHITYTWDRKRIKHIIFNPSELF